MIWRFNVHSLASFAIDLQPLPSPFNLSCVYIRPDTFSSRRHEMLSVIVLVGVAGENESKKERTRLTETREECLSRARPFLFPCACITVWIPVHTALKSGVETYPIYVMIHFQDRLSFASLWFWCRGKRDSGWAQQLSCDLWVLLAFTVIFCSLSDLG